MKMKHGADSLVFFHVGDFYEAYFDDARTVSLDTDVTLFRVTAAGIPAVRIPVAFMEEYRNRLLDAGYKVCVSEVRGASGRHILKSL